MSNPSDSQITETKPTIPQKNIAIIRPRQVFVKKPLAMLRQYEPLEGLPAYLWPECSSDNRWPPVLYHGIPVPTSHIIDHWLNNMLPEMDRTTLNEAELKSLEEPPVPENYFLPVISDLENTLTDAVGWRIRLLPVHGLPGDRYGRVARLRDNYYSHRIPDIVVQKLQEALGTQSPPMWYLTTGVHAQWDSFPGPNTRPRVSRKKTGKSSVN
ncbi:hypothetical protein E4T56_gene18604 [Termitomyces sp. T112]|nr:hypothetical protein C0989_007129 [Termitomyces sp. Mn162]KAG5728739.1 hypothetical protein E4T56_gene18604 [Termitomyces sp. T112]